VTQHAARLDFVEVVGLHLQNTSEQQNQSPTNGKKPSLHATPHSEIAMTRSRKTIRQHMTQSKMNIRFIVMKGKIFNPTGQIAICPAIGVRQPRAHS
jgi:pyruvate/2-oxoglutarate dehydrogenase complex dihydrolipoamide acyltransferase (E2) component